MEIVDLFIGVLVLVVMVVALVVLRAESGHRRKALEHRRERDASGLALVRYIQLNRQCSEEEAYQRLATFVKQHVLFDDSSPIERMVAHDRQSLLVLAQGLLVHDPAAIDKI
jgi:Tfp pilus assembly protein PilV